MAGGDVDEVIDGGEGIGQPLLGCRGWSGTDMRDVAHEAGESVDTGDGGDLVDIDEGGDFADIAVGGAAAEDKDQRDGVVVGFPRQARVAGGGEEVEELAGGAGIVGVVEAEAAIGVGEDIGSAGVGCGGGCGGVDKRKAGGSVAYIVGGKEVDMGVADGLEASVGSALYVRWLAGQDGCDLLGGGVSAADEEGEEGEDRQESGQGGLAKCLFMLS